MKLVSRVGLLIAFFSIAVIPAIAQDDLEEFLTENLDDGEKLIKAYVSPAMQSISSGLNQGWYNTAKPHKIAGFDLTVTVNAMRIPTDELFFKPNDVLGPESQVKFDPNSPDYPNAPTIFGPEGDERRPEFYTEDETTGLRAEFYGPAGQDLKGNLGSNVVPVPMAHLAFGLPKGTEIKVRFVPQMDFGENSTFKMYGIGIMHDVKQWIPGIKSLPFDLSGFVGYTKMELNASFDNPDYEDQRGEFSMTGATVQGIISKKISVLTLYGGAGYNIAKSTLAMKGTYAIGENPITGADKTVKDPFDMKFAASGPRMTAGFRLKLAIFTLHADYTLQKYSCITAGFGLSVR